MGAAHAAAAAAAVTGMEDVTEAWCVKCCIMSLLRRATIAKLAGWNLSQGNAVPSCCVGWVAFKWPPRKQVGLSAADTGLCERVTCSLQAYDHRLLPFEVIAAA